MNERCASAARTTSYPILVAIGAPVWQHKNSFSTQPRFLRNAFKKYKHNYEKQQIKHQRPVLQYSIIISISISTNIVSRFIFPYQTQPLHSRQELQPDPHHSFQIDSETSHSRGGAMPPQPPPIATSDGIYTPPPPLTPIPTPSANDATSLKTLSRSELMERLLAAEQRLSSYHSAASDLLSALVLTPEMTESFYARSLRELLSSALLSLETVDSLSHIECSFPCVRNEIPSVELVNWGGLSYSEWDVDWAPDSWWVSASALGSRWGLGFNCLTTVSGIRLKGLLRCSFADDMSSVRVAFRETPMVNMSVESVVGWGLMPIPVRESIEELVRAEIERFVRERLTEDSVVVVLRRRPAGVSELDIMEARLQATRARSVALRAQTLL